MVKETELVGKLDGMRQHIYPGTNELMVSFNRDGDERHCLKERQLVHVIGHEILVVAQSNDIARIALHQVVVLQIVGRLDRDGCHKHARQENLGRVVIRLVQTRLERLLGRGQKGKGWVNAFVETVPISIQVSLKHGQTYSVTSASIQPTFATSPGSVESASRAT